jgi:EmrB/QacA subfamily drug resistance transporter
MRAISDLVTTSSTRAKPVILVALLAAAFLINLETTMVNVALPVMVKELHATTNQLQWIVDAYNLVFAALLLTMGSLSDRFGRKGVLLAGLAVFGLASIAGGVVTTPGALIAARAVMGFGAAMTFPATLSIISNVFTGRKERAQAIGAWGATAGAAIALGPIAGGFLLEHFSWSSIFVAMGPVAAVAFVLVAGTVPSSRDLDAKRIDGGGLVLSAAFMAIIVYTIIEAPNDGWSANRTLVGYLLSVALLIAFIGWEHRQDEPMLDVQIFSNLRFSAASGSVTVAFFTLFGFIFLIIQYMQFVRGWSPLSAGVHTMPVAVAVGVGSVTGTPLAVKVGTKLIVGIGLLAITAFYLWLGLTFTATTSYGIIAIQMVVFGLGLGFTSAPATDSIMGAVSLGKAGVGSAVNDSTRLLGGTLGVAVIGSVYASTYGSHLGGHLPARLPSAAGAVAKQSVGAAQVVAQRVTSLGHPAMGAAVRSAATRAFMSGLTTACLVAGAVAALGFVMAAVFLPAQPPTALFDEPVSVGGPLVGVAA